MAEENRSEQPTQRKLQNARKEGNFPPAGMAIPAAQLAAYMLLLSSMGPTFSRELAEVFSKFLKLSFRPDALSGAFVLFIPMLSSKAWAFLFPALGITAASLLLQLVLTRFGFSGERLIPQLKRLNPIPRITQLPKNSVMSLGEAFLLLSVAIYIAYRFYADLWASQLLAGDRTLNASIHTGWQLIDTMLSKSAWLAVVFGIFSFIRQRHEHASKLKMTKEEVKKEHKESEGNPQIKMRIRRLQRDLLRRRMMSDVTKATAVIVNPTHYAVALAYEMQSGGAPRVVAKGRNYLAMRIRMKAIKNQIPIVENPPLAQALYQAANVGQEIPANLYRAVAEVLAYIFRIMNGRMVKPN